MRKSLLMLMCMCAVLIWNQNFDLKAQEILTERAFEMLIPAGWTRTGEVPQGFEIGFRKPLPDGRLATLFLHYEIMPAEAAEPPSDTSDIQRQFDSMVKNQFPDANPLKTPAVRVEGRIILNKMYGLTDGGVKVRRRYTYFLAEQTAFVVQCTAPPGYWEATVSDFDSMLVSLKPRPGTPEKKISDDTAVSNLKRILPTLVGSFPAEWTCSIVDAKIIRLPSEESQGTLEITLAWNRPDIAKIYKAVKILFKMMREGKTSDRDLQKLPYDVQQVLADEHGGLMKYVGQVWGCAWGYVANCESPIDQFKIVVLNSKHQRVGSVRISRKDGADILVGKVDASDQQRIVRMYEFE